MKRTIKQLMTTLLALAMLMSMMSVTALAEEGETVAHLSFASEDWGVQYWYDGNDYAPVVATNETVTGYGTYTTALDFTGTDAGFATGIAFLDVEIAGGEAAFPNAYMTIDSFKINGEDVAYSKTYTSSDDPFVDTRTNLYNEWVAEVLEGRTADGGNVDLSAIVFDKSLYPEIQTIEVTFTLGDGVPFGAETVVVAQELPAEGTTAYVAMADNDWAVQHWFDGNDYAPVVANFATVTGYGTYTTSLDFTGVEGGVCPDIAFMDVEIKDGELYFPFSYMQIDSVKINGEEVVLGNTYTSSDNKLDTRTNLYNSWVAEVEEGRTNGLELSEVTPIPVDGANITNIETVEVTFTLMEGEPMVAEEEVYVMPTEFNAFMMFSDTSDAWQSYAPGTSGDTTVIGDGKYTVSLKASDIGATGKAEMGQVFLVDIEGLGRAMVELGTLSEADDESLTVTDLEVAVKVWVDGVEVNVKNKNILMGDIEGNERLRLELYNAWGTGTADAPVVMPELLTPEDEIVVEFTLVGTGLNTGAIIEEEPAEVAETVEAAPVETVEETPAEITEEVPAEEGGMGAGTIIIIVVGAVVVMGGVVYMLTKKK